MTKNNSATPMMKQYFDIKNKYRDALLFYRMGDFYEMFYEDAKVASSVLEIALTSRQKIPMCGVPYHAADTYLAKLLKRGFRVAVCEQVEDPKKAKGVVKRDVVKVLTPGTAVELERGESKEGTFVASLILQGEDWGLALVDLASGRMQTAQSDADFPRSLNDEIFRAAPKEIIFPEEQAESARTVLSRNGLNAVLQSPQEDWIFDFSQSRSLLQDHFQVSSLSGFGLAEKPLAVAAAGALLFYLKKLRKDSLTLIRGVSFVGSREFMVLDATTIKNLELVRNLRDGRLNGSFLDVIDFTGTAMGGRLLRNWLLHPLLDCDRIRSRQDAVAELLERVIERRELSEKLRGIFDLERLSGKISLGVANAKDLVALKKSLVPLPEIRTLVGSLQSFPLREMHSRWDSAEDLVDMIESALLDEPAFLLTEGGIIKSGYRAELDELRDISRSGKGFISQMEQKERTRTGISSLKIRHNKVFGYYIDVTKPNLHLVPDDYIRKQTLVNSERFITPELKEYENKVLHAEERIGKIEYDLFIELRNRLADQLPRLQTIAAVVARMDVLCSLAELASQRNYVRPLVNDGDEIVIEAGRHPVIEVLNEEPFIPNDTFLDRETDQILIITGPNMGGKSTYLRQVALICILAQMGSFVPAKKADIGLADRIFTRIGAMDFLSVGQSTFMVEMLETSNILHNATERSLLLLDEVGRGTSTFDGLSLAWAIAEYLHENEAVRAKTLFATHYHELTELSLTLNRIRNYHVTVKEWKDEIVFLRKIVKGPSDQSYGIHVAKLAGIPPAVINRAREILFNLEKKELDGSGRPKIAYTENLPRDENQYLLFLADRRREKQAAVLERIEDIEMNELTPMEAMNVLAELQKKLKDES